MTDENKCIICHDIGDEPIFANIKCPCKYHYHNSCWVEYVHSKQILTCPYCSKNITIRAVNTTPLLNIPTLQYNAIQPVEPQINEVQVNEQMRRVIMSGCACTFVGVMVFGCILLCVMIVVIIIAVVL